MTIRNLKNNAWSCHNKIFTFQILLVSSLKYSGIFKIYEEGHNIAFNIIVNNYYLTFNNADIFSVMEGNYQVYKVKSVMMHIGKAHEQNLQNV